MSTRSGLPQAETWRGPPPMRRSGLAAISYQRMRAHQVVIGTTGTGKTTPHSRYYLAA